MTTTTKATLDPRVDDGPDLRNTHRDPHGVVTLDGNHALAGAGLPDVLGRCWPLHDAVSVGWVWVSDADPREARYAPDEAACFKALLTTWGLR